MRRTKTATTTPTPALTRLSESWGTQSQSHVYIAIHGFLNETIRIKIVRNAYDDQSSARAEIYDPASRAWHEIASLLTDEMQTCVRRINPHNGYLIPLVSYTSSLDDEGRTAFRLDEAELLRLVEIPLRRALPTP